MRSIIIIAGFLLTTSAGWAGSNLVVNGHFSDTNELLHGWKYNYEDTGNELYAANHTYVSVTSEESKNHVLALQANNDILIGTGQGVMVDSDPIPFAPMPFKPGSYKFSVWAKTTGPDCRILVEGYRWKPGIKPHANPKLKELRKCYRFVQLTFSPETLDSLNFGRIKPELGWTHASQTFPDEKMSKLAMESFNKIQFLVVHILAMSGIAKDPEWVYLYVDDVELERISK